MCWHNNKQSCNNLNLQMVPSVLRWWTSHLLHPVRRVEHHVLTIQVNCKCLDIVLNPVNFGDYVMFKWELHSHDPCIPWGNSELPLASCLHNYKYGLQTTKPKYKVIIIVQTQPLWKLEKTKFQNGSARIQTLDLEHWIIDCLTL